MLSEVNKNARDSQYKQTYIGINNVSYNKAGVPVEREEPETTLQVKATTK